MKPDLLQFNKDVLKADFQTGVGAGMWGVMDENPERPTWPCVYIWIESTCGGDDPIKYYFKFDLSGYPSQAPTACPWDIDNNRMLPVAERPECSQAVKSVFHSGFQNSTCLYTPLDRLAQVQHEQWKTEYPKLWWKSLFTITNYVKYIYELLN